MGEEYYALLAEQERQRQRNIARAYWNGTPTLSNIYGAAQAFWNSLPFVGIGAADMNPYIQTGIADVPGKNPLKPLGAAKSVTSKGRQIVKPVKTSQQRSAEYYRELKEDKALGIGKRQRNAFKREEMLSDGDQRHGNTGRPSLKQVREANAHIQNYPQSAQRDYNRVLIKAAKNGYDQEHAPSYSPAREFLEDLIIRYGHIY